VTRLARVGLLLAVTALAACSGGSKRSNPIPSTLVVAGAFPTYGAERVPTEAMKAAVEARIRARGGRMGAHRVAYVDYVTSSAGSAGQENEEQCRSAAVRITKDDRVVAVIGPLSTACARTLVPVLNQAGIAVVSPTNSTSGLTHEVPDWRRVGPCFLCTPGRLYPTGRRNFARVIATEDSEGRAAAVLLHRLGVKRAFVLTDGEQFNTVELAGGFLAEAPNEGLTVARAAYTPTGGPYGAVARRVAASGAGALYLLAPTYNRGTQVLEAIRRAGFRGPVVSSLSVVQGTIATRSSPWQSVLFTSPRLPLAAMARTAVSAGEAAGVGLDAIRRSDGSRAGVRRMLFSTSGPSLLGPIAIDKNGDVHPQRIAVFRLSGSRFAYLSTIRLP
jgi:branched-chain amino acid transport system substrate-binding protein